MNGHVVHKWTCGALSVYKIGNGNYWTECYNLYRH